MSTTSGLTPEKLPCNTLNTAQLAAVFTALSREQRRAVITRATQEFAAVRTLIPAWAYAAAVKWRIFSILAAEHVGCVLED